MPADLRLSGAIPGLLRRGSPVHLRPRCYQGVMLDGAAMVYYASGAGFTFMSTTFSGSDVIGRADPGDGTLDLTDPTGRYHALLWLRERGYNLRWAEDEADVLAWSVLSVSRGGGPIVAILPEWEECGGGEWARYGRRDSIGVALGMVAGWNIRRFNANPISGPETGAPGRDAADRAALAAGYALRNADGSLTLPELPKETT